MLSVRYWVFIECYGINILQRMCARQIFLDAGNYQLYKLRARFVWKWQRFVCVRSVRRRNHYQFTGPNVLLQLRGRQLRTKRWPVELRALRCGHLQQCDGRDWMLALRSGNLSGTERFYFMPVLCSWQVRLLIRDVELRQLQSRPVCGATWPDRLRAVSRGLYHGRCWA